MIKYILILAFILSSCVRDPASILNDCLTEVNNSHATLEDMELFYGETSNVNLDSHSQAFLDYLVMTCVRKNIKRELD